MASPQVSNLLFQQLPSHCVTEWQTLNHFPSHVCSKLPFQPLTRAELSPLMHAIRRLQACKHPFLLPKTSSVTEKKQAKNAFGLEGG